MPKVRSKKKKRSSGAVKLSKHDLKELRLFAMNDYGIYRQLEAFAKNYARKKLKGKYNRTLAIKGITNNVVPNILRSYKKQFGGFHRVSATDKKKIGQALLGYVNELRDDFIKNRPALLKRGS